MQKPTSKSKNAISLVAASLLIVVVLIVASYVAYSLDAGTTIGSDLATSEIQMTSRANNATTASSSASYITTLTDWHIPSITTSTDSNYSASGSSSAAISSTAASFTTTSTASTASSRRNITVLLTELSSVLSSLPTGLAYDSYSNTAWGMTANDYLMRIDLATVHSDLRGAVKFYPHIFPENSGNRTIGEYVGSVGVIVLRDGSVWICGLYGTGDDSHVYHAFASFNPASLRVHVYFDHSDSVMVDSYLRTDGVNIYLEAASGYVQGENGPSEFLLFDSTTHVFSSIDVAPLQLTDRPFVVAGDANSQVSVWFEAVNTSMIDPYSLHPSAIGVAQVKLDGSGLQFYPHVGDLYASDLKLDPNTGLLWLLYNDGSVNQTLVSFNTQTGSYSNGYYVGDYPNTQQGPVAMVLADAGIWLLGGPTQKLQFFSFATLALDPSSTALLNNASPSEGFLDSSGNLWSCAQNAANLAGGRTLELVELLFQS